MMRLLVCVLASALTLIVLSNAVANPQRSTELTGRALRKQDRQACTTQSIQQNVVRRNRAEFMRKCMADRQGGRRAAARAVRKQDRQVCTTHFGQQNIARRNRAEFVRKCMADRQG